MTLTTKSKIYKFLLLQLVISLVGFSNLYAQQRRDEEIPKIVGSIKSITNLTGWAKNDIGKWYQFNSFNLGGQILKIDISRIKYENNEYLCLVAFDKSFYIRANVKHIEYGAFVWLLDSSKHQTLKFSDTSVHTILYQNIIITSLFNYQPVSWNDILIQLKKCFIGTSPNEFDAPTEADTTLKELNNTSYIYLDNNIDSSYNPSQNLFIKYRYDYHLNKAEFYVGTVNVDEINYDVSFDNGEEKSYETFDFDFTDSFLGIAKCYDKDKIKILNCCYFEVQKNKFENCFKSIIK